jgi:hypothetical protein
MLAKIKNLNYVGVAKAGDRLGFDLKPDQPLLSGVFRCPDHLKGDDSAEPGLPGFVDNAHSAAFQHAQDLEPGDEEPVRRSRLG